MTGSDDGHFLDRDPLSLGFELRIVGTHPLSSEQPCVNVAILTAQFFLRFIPKIWIIFALVLFEGLLGGAAFVNTFYKISEDIEAEFKEFSLAAATIADSVGISIAGAISIPAHNRICSLNLKM
uniref:Battenin n=1 Tax=Magallana gigas TaxID=29159 RepID=K1RIK8_MAGGI